LEVLVRLFEMNKQIVNHDVLGFTLGQR
jgi:hypothetical protein